MANILNKKRSSIIVVTLIIITAFILISSSVFMSINEQLINKNSLLIEYNNTFMLIETMLVITILLLIIDHDEKYQVMYIALIGRKKEGLVKTLIYVLLISIISYTIYQIYISIPLLFTQYYEMDKGILKTFVSSYLSILALFFLTSIIVSSKRKPLIFVVLLLYMVVTFTLEENDYFLLYYMFPFSRRLSLGTTHGITYQIIYVFMMFYLNIIYNNRRKLS